MPVGLVNPTSPVGPRAESVTAAGVESVLIPRPWIGYSEAGDEKKKKVERTGASPDIRGVGGCRDSVG